MIGPHVTDQIPAYALDCLDQQEASQVEAHLTVCAACRAELKAYKATAAYLGLVAPQVQPPPRLKASILRRVKEPQAAHAAAIAPENWRARVVDPRVSLDNEQWTNFGGGQPAADHCPGCQQCGAV